MGESFNLIKSYVCWNSLRLLPLSQPAFMQQMDHIDTDTSGILPLNFDKDKLFVKEDFIIRHLCLLWGRKHTTSRLLNSTIKTID